VTGTYEYDAFGAVRAQSGVTTEWSYTGEQNDPTGLEYLRARYYDKGTGRFLSQDPVPLLQRYAYANGNPANLVDPSGLYTAKDAQDALVARFEQLMAAERAIQAVAKQILADPCWKTHAFCKHVAFVWKRIAPDIYQCAMWGAGGAAFGGGAVGFAAGCAAGVMSHEAQRQGGKWDNPVGACLTWGGAAAGAAKGTGGAWTFAFGCVGGTVDWLDTKYGPNNGPSKCAIWAASGGGVAGAGRGPFPPGSAFAGCFVGDAALNPPSWFAGG
jgi:RHS repeat-associated protein